MSFAPSCQHRTGFNILLNGERQCQQCGKKFPPARAASAVYVQPNGGRAASNPVTPSSLLQTWINEGEQKGPQSAVMVFAASPVSSAPVVRAPALEPLLIFVEDDPLLLIELNVTDKIINSTSLAIGEQNAQELTQKQHIQAATLEAAQNDRRVIITFEIPIIGELNSYLSNARKLILKINEWKKALPSLHASLICLSFPHSQLADRVKLSTIQTSQLQKWIGDLLQELEQPLNKCQYGSFPIYIDKDRRFEDLQFLERVPAGTKVICDPWLSFRPEQQIDYKKSLELAVNIAQCSVKAGQNLEMLICTSVQKKAIMDAGIPIRDFAVLPPAPILAFADALLPRRLSQLDQNIHFIEYIDTLSYKEKNVVTEGIAQGKKCFLLSSKASAENKAYLIKNIINLYANGTPVIKETIRNLFFIVDPKTAADEFEKVLFSKLSKQWINFKNDFEWLLEIELNFIVDWRMVSENRAAFIALLSFLPKGCRIWIMPFPQQLTLGKFKNKEELIHVTSQQIKIANLEVSRRVIIFHDAIADHEKLFWEKQGFEIGPLDKPFATMVGHGYWKKVSSLYDEQKQSGR